MLCVFVGSKVLQRSGHTVHNQLCCIATRQECDERGALMVNVQRFLLALVGLSSFLLVIS